MSRSARWVLWGLFLGAVWGGAIAEEALTPEQLQEDIRLLQAIQKLNLTRQQGLDLLAHLEKIGQSQATIQAQEALAYASLREALAALKEALLQGVPPPALALRKMDLELGTLQKVYDRENPRLEKEIRLIFQEVLTAEQRQRLEPDQAKQERLARERQERKRREQVRLEAFTVIEKWVRNKENVSDVTFQQQRQEKATPLAIEAVGQQDMAQLNQVTSELVELFDYCRKLDDRQYLAQREAIQKQLQTILQPRVESPEEAYYIMSESEFLEFLRQPRVAQLLRERLPYLPSE
jgi:hypothetical protein